MSLFTHIIYLFICIIWHTISMAENGDMAKTIDATKIKAADRKKVDKKKMDKKADKKKTKNESSHIKEAIPTASVPVNVPAVAATTAATASNTIASLPLPRFASVRAKKVNLHVGPGINFPVSWLLQRQQMPVEIIAEFDTWRQIRDWQGTEGWVHKSLLMGKRSFWTLHKTQELKVSPDKSAKIVAYVQATVTGRLLECQAQWCKVEVTATENAIKGKAYKGWLPRQSIWGVYPHESKF
jgi:SH3-like domain-containing protein